MSKLYENHLPLDLNCSSRTVTTKSYFWGSEGFLCCTDCKAPWLVLSSVCLNVISFSLLDTIIADTLPTTTAWNGKSLKGNNPLKNTLQFSSQTVTVCIVRMSRVCQATARLALRCIIKKWRYQVEEMKLHTILYRNNNRKNTIENNWGKKTKMPLKWFHHLRSWELWSVCSYQLYLWVVLLTHDSEIRTENYNSIHLSLFVLQEKVQLQYRLTFTMGEQEHSESGSLEQFPPPETWGNL